jgi:hypothetical protein
MEYFGQDEIFPGLIRYPLKKGCRLNRVIVDKFNVIAEGTSIGFDAEADRRAGAYHFDGSGIVVVPEAERDITRTCSGLVIADLFGRNAQAGKKEYLGF